MLVSPADSIWVRVTTTVSDPTGLTPVMLVPVAVTTTSSPALAAGFLADLSDLGAWSDGADAWSAGVDTGWADAWAAKPKAINAPSEAPAMPQTRRLDDASR